MHALHKYLGCVEIACGITPYTHLYQLAKNSLWFTIIVTVHGKIGLVRTW